MIALRLSFCIRAQKELDLRLQNFEIQREGKQVGSQRKPIAGLQWLLESIQQMLLIMLSLGPLTLVAV
jgi:hypothetical protein